MSRSLRQSLDFLDGYLFRVMVDILQSHGPEAGLYSYYEARIQGGYALSPYDRMIFDFALKHFSCQERRIVHAGIGVGTLTSVLAIAGYHIAGIEQDGKRFAVASRIKDALVPAWPEVAERYELFGGAFPAVVDEAPWMGPGTVLIFTNCGAGWSEELTTQIVASLVRCGDTILDARLFGKVRGSQVERQELLDRIEMQGLGATPIAESPPGSFYYHIQPKPKIGLEGSSPARL